MAECPICGKKIEEVTFHFNGKATKHEVSKDGFTEMFETVLRINENIYDKIVICPECGGIINAVSKKEFADFVGGLFIE